MQERIQDLSNLHGNLETKKKELVESSTIVKQEMAAAFEEIRMRLQKKEKELMENADIYLQEHVQELNTYSRVIHSKIISLNKLIDNINSHRLRNDEINMLNFYSDNHNKVIQLSESDMPEIPDINTLYAMKVSINPGSLEDLISTLNGIHTEITSLKGHQIQKMNNPQRFIMKREMYGLQSNTGFTGYNTNGFSDNNKVIKTSTGNFSHDNSYDFSRNNMVLISY